MKKFAALIIVLIVVAVAGLLVAPGFVDWSQYKGQIKESVREFTGHELDIGGEIRFAILPAPSLYVEDLSLVSEGFEKPVISIARTNINISLSRLLSGELAVDRVRLVEPVVNLTVAADGRRNWMSPKIEAMLEGNAGKLQDGSGSVPDNSADQNGIMRNISLDSIRIEKGYVEYGNLPEGVGYSVSDLDLNLRAETLSGPFKGEGSLVYDGLELLFSASTGRLDNLESVAIQTDLELPEKKTRLRFSGVLAAQDEPEVQGELSVESGKLSAVLPDVAVLSDSALGESVSLKGLLTASQTNASLKNGLLTIAGAPVAASLDLASIDAPPYKIAAKLDWRNPLDVNKFIRPGNGKEKAESGGFLPDTLSLPVPVILDLEATAPAVNYSGRQFETVSARASWDGQALTSAFNYGKGPGSSALDAKTTLAYASKSESKDGGVIVSDPELDAEIRFLTENISSVAGIFLPEALSSVAMLRLYDSIDANINVNATPDVLTLRESVIELDQSNVSLSGQFRSGNAGDSARPSLSVEAVVSNVDLDRILARLSQSGAEATANNQGGAFDPVESLRALSLPIDLSVNVSVQNVNWSAMSMKVGGVRLDADLTENSLALEQALIEDFFSGRFSANGKIANLETLDGIDFTVAGEAKDVEAILDALKVDVSVLPRPFGALSFQTDVNGSAEELGFRANVKALKGTFDASGQLTGLPATPKVNNLTASVQHPNFVEAVRIVNPEFKAAPGLEKPLEFYASVARDAELYTLSDLKANIGPMPVQGKVRIDMGGSVPDIQGSLDFGTIPLSDFLATTKSSGNSGGGAAAQGQNVRWSRNAVPTDWMHALNLDLTLKALALNYNRWSFTNPGASVSLEDGRLALENLEAGLFGGDVKGALTAESVKGERSPLKLSANLDVDQVAIESFVTALTGARLVEAQGRASLMANLNASGISPAALIADLSGKGTMNGTDFILKGVDFGRLAEALSGETKPGDTVTGIWKSATRGGQTQFDTIDGEFNIQNGIVNINPLTLDGPEARVVSTGPVNLPQWTIALENTISLKGREDIPEFTVSVSGPLDNPGQTFGQGLLQDYLQRKIQRKAQDLIKDKVGGQFGDVLNKALGGNAPAQQPKQQPQPAPEQSQESPANDNQPEAQQEEQQQPPAQQEEQLPPEVELFKGILNEITR